MGFNSAFKGLNKDFFMRTLDSGLKTAVNNGMKSTFPMSFDQPLDGKHKHCSVHKNISHTFHELYTSASDGIISEKL
jgi:hypothetical protein